MTRIPFPIYLMIPSGVLIFAIGLYSWIKIRKKENFIFFLLTITQSLWSIGTFVMWKSYGNERMIIFWDRLLYLPALFMPALIYHFSLEFCKIKKQRFLLYLSYFIAIFLAVLSRTDYFVKDVFYYKWGCHTVAQFGHHIYPLSIIIFTSLAFYSLFKTWRNKKESSLKRTQAIYILLAFFVFALASIELLPPYQIAIYPVFYLALPVFTLIVAYAITEKHLFAYVVAADILVAALLIFVATFLIFPEIKLGFAGKLVFFILITFFGYLLSRYAHREAMYRERIQKAYEVEKKAHKALKRLDEAKNQFIMATQHHLRTPLTSMIGYLDLIFGGTYGKVSPKIKETLLKFQVSTRRLIKIVNEFLDITQFQLGKEVLTLKPNIDIKPILKEIMEELQLEAKARGIYLKLQKSEKIPRIKTDPEKLKIALFNIVDNGIKYTPKGGVIVKCQPSDNKLQIIVRDTGMGIPKEELKTLFTRTFERSKEAKKVYGTGRGIGLFIASHIIKAHKGKIWAESEGVGKGSTFYVELPVK